MLKLSVRKQGNYNINIAKRLLDALLPVDDKQQQETPELTKHPPKQCRHFNTQILNPDHVSGISFETGMRPIGSWKQPGSFVTVTYNYILSPLTLEVNPITSNRTYEVPLIQ